MKLSEDWEEVEVGTISIPRKEQGYVGREKYIEIGDIDIETKKYSFKDKKSIEGCKKAYYEDVLISRVRPTRGAISLVLDKEIKTSSAFTILKTKESLIPRYLFYFLAYNKAFFKHLEKVQKGSSYPSCREKDILGFKIIYPKNKKTQQKIVSILEKAEQAKELRKEADELTYTFLKSIFYEMFGDPVKNSKKWNESTIGKYLEYIKYGTGSPPKYSDRGIPFIRATNIKNGRIIEEGLVFIDEQEAKKIGKCKLYENDLIIVRSGVNTGDCSVVNKKYVGAYGGYDLIFHPNQAELNSTFLNEFLSLKSSKLMIEKLSRRAGQPHLNAKQISEFELLVPLISLQNKFASIVKQVEDMKGQQKQSKNHLDNLFNVLMQKAFKGELAC